MTQRTRIFSVAGLYDGAGRFVEEADVHIVDGVVARVLSRKDDRDECARLHADAERFVVPNGLVLPGLVNSHHHAYSALARGMPLRGDLSDFPHVLENLWWRLDRALDLEAVRLCGLVTAIECVRRGCTAIVDHHASPSCVGGSLDALAGAFGALSMTAALCFETSDRNGPAVFEESVAENLDFAARHRAHERLRGLFGLHASFTLSHASLALLAKAVPDDLPLHAHVAEDRCDLAHARAEGFTGPLDRLAKLGVLRRGSLLAHCVPLAD
ncbi:MAG: amidohydrolase family protein, partial [Proteobacteria bacterium]|nr:amidohydrolase family protein [Pseudomonadota bacterium]